MPRTAARPPCCKWAAGPDRMRRLLFIAALLLVGAGAVQAQDKAQTLADIKAELSALMSQFTALKAELVTNGALTSAAGGGDALQRMDAMEAELTRLTAKTEAVELKLKKVVADGTNQIGDMQFRLCTVTPNCDPNTLPPVTELGSDAAAAPTAAPADTASPAVDAGQSGGGDLAVNEQADFDRAKAVLDSGDFRSAADLFGTFATTYTGGELTQAAQVLQGDALDQLGDIKNSARAYLQAFSGQPTGPKAGEALTKLGISLGKLGQTSQACLTLTEVGKRFPGTPDEASAKVAMSGLGCS
jgi:tol-pal system protein YbgF